ncbi:hypothetical protein GCM10023080_083900 [Streptomyces pseudoechinosporeus]
MSRASSPGESSLLAALRPFARGSFNLYLVLDAAPSMEVWDGNTAQLVTVIRDAPFLGVRVYRLDTSMPTALRCVDDNGTVAPAADVFCGRTDGRVLLLATDGLGAAWHDGRMAGLLRGCAEHTSLAVLQLLPQRLWFRTGAPIVDVEWCADLPGTPSRSLRRRPPAAPATGPWPPVDDAVPLIGFGLGSLKTWARLAALGDSVWRSGLGLRLEPPRPLPAPKPRPREDDLVHRFLRTAESDSKHLAALLAVAPVVTVPLLRGMHRRMLPDRGDFPVAEAFLSGLLRPARLSGAVTGRAYTFHPDVAKTLEATLTPSAKQRALAVAEEFLPTDAWESTRLQPSIPYAHRPPSKGAEHGPELEVSYQHLPSRNSYFTGRGALLQHLRRTLTAQEYSPYVLYGTGGVGKTQMALEYAHRYQGTYDFVWWVEASDPAKVMHSLEELGAALGIAARPTGVPPVAAVLDWLRRGRTRNGWLLVMNNAESPDRLCPLLPHGNGHVVVTTRSVSWTTQLPFLRIPPFSRAESISLLRRLVPELPAQDADALAERSGDLPLAILQIGRSLSGVGLDVAAHLAEFDELCATLLQMDGLLDYPVPLVASWQVALKALDEDMPAAVDLFRLLCHLGIGPVPQDLLFAGVGSSMPPGPGAVLCQAVGLHRALQRLGDAGLATVDKAIHGAEVHRVLQLVARRNFMDPQQRRQADEAVLCLLAAAVPDSPTIPASRRRMTEIVRRLDLVRALASERPEVRDLVVATVRHHHALGDLDLARGTAELAEQYWQSDPRARPIHLDAIRHCLELPPSHA